MKKQRSTEDKVRAYIRSMISKEISENQNKTIAEEANKLKFKIGDAVKLKTNLGMKLEVLRIKDMGSYYQYSCLDTYGNTFEVHQTMLIDWL